MKRFIEGEDRRQTTLLPDTLEDYVTQDNSVRVIDVFIDEAGSGGIGLCRHCAEATGRPSYHPATLLKIYLYGYLNRIQSSRRLERESQRNIELMWLTGRLMPDFKTMPTSAATTGSDPRRLRPVRGAVPPTQPVHPSLVATRRAAWNCKLANRRQRVTDAAPPTPTTSRNFAIKRCASLSRPRSTTNASLTHGARAGQRKRRAGASIRQGSNKAAWRHFQPMRRASPRGRPRQGKIP